MKRPALRLFVGFALGIWLGKAFRVSNSSSGEFIAAGMLLLLLGGALWRPRTFAYLSGFASIILGMLWISDAEVNFQKQTVRQFAQEKGSVFLSGKIISPPQIQRDRLKWTLRAERLFVRGKPFSVTGKVLVSSEIVNLPVCLGERVGLEGHLRLPPPRRNPGEFDYRAYLKRRGISTLFYVSANRPLRFQKTRSHNVVARMVSPLRRRFLLFIQTAFGFGTEAHLLKGLLLGQRGEIEPSVRTAFARTGVIHVLAVSGLHVGFVLGLLLFLLKFFRFPRWLNLIVVLLALVFYATLTGNKPPVVRASVMAFLILLGYRLQRRPDIVNILAFAALLLLLLNPFFLFDASFQLSFLAVLGIVLFYTRTIAIISVKPKSRLHVFVNKSIFPLLAVSFAAQLGTLPLIVYYYHRIPLYALAANLVVIPAVFAIVTGGFLFLGLWWVSPVLAAPLVVSLRFLLNFLIRFVTFFSHLPGGNLEIPGHISPWLGLAFFLLLGFVWFANNPLRLRQLALTTLVLGAAWLSWNSARAFHPSLQVDFLDVNKSSAAVVRLPDGKALLVNAGSLSPRFDQTRHVLLPFLHYSNLKEAEALAVSRWQPSFAGGVASLLRSFPTQEIWYPQFASLPSPLQKARKKVACRLRALEAGAHFLRWHGVNLWVLAPDSIQKNAPLIFKLVLGRCSFLFAEGASFQDQENLTRFGRLLASDVLILSGGQVSESLVRIVNPQYFVLRKKWNSYDSAIRPGARLFEIPATGCVEFRTDGVDLHVNALRRGQVPPKKSQKKHARE